MADIATVNRTKRASEAPLKLDAAVIGAGVAGLYQLHLLRSQGLAVKAFDAASDVGGTWYWNRYPGARFDSEGYIYQYLFSEELYKGWSWSEKFPGQPEIRNCSGRRLRFQAAQGRGRPSRVRRMASMARIDLRRAVSTTDRISA